MGTRTASSHVRATALRKGASMPHKDWRLGQGEVIVIETDGETWIKIENQKGKIAITKKADYIEEIL
jgi:hypothetical protein